MTISSIQNSDQPQTMAEALQSDAMRALPKVGDIVTGLVLKIAKTEVLIDLPGLTTGVVRGEELFDESGEYSDLHVSDEVAATVVDMENETGQMELSFRSAGHKRAWDRLKELMDGHKTLDAKILSANKGGLMIEVERVQGFLPVSQLAPEHYPRVQGGDKQKILEKINQYIHQIFKVKILDLDEKQNKLIVSEKKAQADEQKERMNQYKPGDLVDGSISGVTNFGAFLRFGDGLEGLIHISELSWQRLDHPNQVVKVGDAVKAKILTIDESKISLSMKQLENDPWQSIADTYHIGQVVKGTVTKLQPFGLFVQIAPQIQGLVHVSELDTVQVGNPSSVAKIGDELELQIISLEPNQHRLGLSRRALIGDTVTLDATPTPVVEPVPSAEPLSPESVVQQPEETPQPETV